MLWALQPSISYHGFFDFFLDGLYDCTAAVLEEFYFLLVRDRYGRTTGAGYVGIAVSLAGEIAAGYLGICWGPKVRI